MAEKIHCDRCDAVVTTRPRSLALEVTQRTIDVHRLVPMRLSQGDGHMLPIQIQLSVQQSDGDNGWDGCDLCVVCFRALLEVFYKAHQGAIGEGVPRG